jgi:hypothetical protein
MPKSYRFKTNIGVDREVRLNIEQDFDFLEILSLKLTQEDLYERFCADYGVVVGRVVANGGLGVPNALISIFIKITNEDADNPIISTLYPYRTPGDKNEDGYRYNLLPYENEYLGHTATGTFPTRQDILTRREVLEVYEKYYKYTVRTNESGDFMIVGVPTGPQKIVMDLDLSNIGEFSLRPSDLIRMGMGVPEQFNGELFKSSEDLDSLPQIVHEVLDINVSSFWGEGEVCDVGITRVDFDLRNFGIDIQPHSVFMGSILSSNEDDYIKGNCKPKNDTGKLCDLITGIGKILCIRQTINLDADGYPVLEEYKLPDGGYVIDENGVWLIEIPMNLEYLITDEFGNRIVSNDASKGIPTQGKYRFKIGWDVEGGLTNEIQRANYLIPNIKEHGWVNGVGSELNQIPVNRNSSYAFSLDWSEYYDIDSAIKCEDTFYNFYYNKVYTVASHIDRFKWGRGRQKHIGIKEINDKSCQSENNRFPVNDAQRNGNVLIFLFNLLLTILTPTFITLIVLLHVLALIYPVIRFIINFIVAIVNGFIFVICLAVALLSRRIDKEDCKEALIEKLPNENPFKNISLPMLTYPDCETCECRMETVDNSSETSQSLLDNISEFTSSGVLIGSSAGDTYKKSLCSNNFNNEEAELLTGQLVHSGYDQRTDGYYEDIWGGSPDDHSEWYKSPVYMTFDNDEDPNISNFYVNSNPTYSQGLNLMNRRNQYYETNFPMAITTTVQNDIFGLETSDPIYDMPLVLIMENRLSAGQLFTLNDPNKINDPNLGKEVPTNFSTTGYVTKTIKGVKNDPSGDLVVDSTIKIYNPNETKIYDKTAGVEYFQVITAFTFNEIINLIDFSKTSILRNIVNGWTQHYGCDNGQANKEDPDQSVVVPDGIEDFKNSFYITVVVRGVDVYTPRQRIKYNISKLFGRSNNNWYDFDNNVTVEGDYYLNIPIQRNTNYSGSTLKTNVWRQDNRTPVPHHQRKYNVDHDLLFVQSYNSNSSVDFTNNNGGPYDLMDLPNLWNPSFTLMFPEDDWVQFNTKAPNKYVSVDKSFTHETELNQLNELFEGGEIDLVNVQTNPIANSFQQRIEGCGFQYSKQNVDNRDIENPKDVITFSSLYFGANPQLSDPYGGDQPVTTLSTSTNLIFRSDRIPSSDFWDEPSDIDTDDIYFRRYGLHLNLNFKIYAISDDGEIEVIGNDLSFQPTDSSGNYEDSQEDSDDYGSDYSSSILESFSCEGMVPLDCYVGSGESFTIEDPCDIPGALIESNERLVNGCYRFVIKKLILTIPRDIEAFFEYRTRMRFMFAVCQGIIGEMFQNNWINGTLYYPSFQKKTFYDSDNEVSRYKYCGDPQQPNDNLKFQGPIYFNTDTNTFYYRSTPYNDNTDKFLGQESTRYDRYRTNKRNIWFPTTIMDLGPKNKYLKEIVLSDVFGEYIMDKLRTTSYADNSNLINLFIISRLQNSNFLEDLLNLGDASISKIFSRDDQSFFDSRIDGDFAQMVSINSEIGVTPFLEADYRNDQIYVGDETFGIWFESDVILRRILTNGVTTFGLLPDGPTNTFGYEKTQLVPYYMWKVNNNGELFGTDLNTWTTDVIYSSKYQGDDFFYSPVITPIKYMKPDSGYGLGYIYNRSINDETFSEYPVTDINDENFKVGSPFYFYFGLKRGKSALNRFVKKYITVESV